MQRLSQREEHVKPSTYRHVFHRAVQTMQSGPSDGAGVQVDQLVPDDGERGLDLLEVFQQKQHTAVTDCQEQGVVSKRL